MRPLGIRELAPGFDLGPGVLHTQELVRVKTFFPKAPVEGFNKGIPRRFAGGDEVQLDVVLGGPAQKRPATEFGAVIDAQALRAAPLTQGLLSGFDDDRARQALPHSNEGADPRGFVDHRQAPEGPLGG